MPKLVLVALTALLLVAAPAQAAIVINEVESQPVDWVELHNTGAAAVDIGGYTIDDDSNGGSRFTVPVGTSIAAGGFYTTPDGPVGLGNPDGVRLFPDAGASTIDSFSYGPHASRTYGRCPDGTGALVQTLAATRDAANSCIDAGTAWPGGSETAVASPFNFSANLSGLAYEPSGTSARGVLYAVRNNETASLFRLVHDGTGYVPDTANGWANGKQLFFPDGGGVPDAEGITLDPSDPGAIYASIERNDVAAGGVDDIPRPGVLRFDVTGAGTTLTATREWPLAADLVGVSDSNAGFEALAWIPDDVLVAKGFQDEGTAAAYAPGTYPDHGGGLFFVGVEQTGEILAFALGRTTGMAVRVATIASGFPAVMSLDYEPETKLLWAACDDTCDGRTATFDVATSGAEAGSFRRTAIFSRPAGMANLNNEGFAIAPQAECVAGRKPVFYADDSNVGGTALRTGTLKCTTPPVVIFDPPPGPGGPPVVTPGPTGPPPPQGPGLTPSGPPPPVSAPRDTRRPTLTRVRASRASVAFRLSERARVQVTVEKRVGRRFVRLARFTSSQAAGSRTIRFRGRVSAARLRSGVLRISLRATDAAGNASAVQRRTVGGAR